MTMGYSAVDRFADTRTILLTTYRRDGSPVGTPVNVAVESGRALIRTWDTAGKLKRMRNNPEVEIAPSTFRGKVTGPAMRARARVLSGAQSERARKLLGWKYPLLQGILVPLIHRLQHQETVHIELMPLDDGSTVEAAAAGTLRTIAE
jgi:PPOX class probable F420-dependent enzyme